MWLFQPIQNIDVALMQLVHQLTSPLLTNLAVVASNLGSTPAIGASLLLILGWCLLRQEPRRMVIYGGGVLLAVGSNLIFKEIWQRPRPHLWPHLVSVDSYSFPSGHSTAAAALATVIIIMAWPSQWRWPVVGLAVSYAGAVGLSRMYLGVHYPSDVLVGWTAGVLSVLLMRALAQRFLKVRSAQ